MRYLFDAILIVAAPFLIPGLIAKTKAFWSGRHGAPLLQPFHTFIKLLKKGEVVSTQASFVFRIYPSVVWGASLSSLLLVPMVSGRAFVAFPGDFVVFALCLALSKFFSLLGALDTGGAFEGMGASREATFTSLVEMAFFVIVASLGTVNGGFSLSAAMALPAKGGEILIIATILTASALFLILLIESARVPIDDPETHLELTMIHEAMVLDNSGPDLAFIQHSSGIKMLALSSMVIDVLLPRELSPAFSALAMAGGLVLIALVIGTLESAIARLRLSRVPQFIFIVNSAALFVFSCVLLFVFRGIH